MAPLDFIHACVCASMIILKACEDDILQTTFNQIYNFATVGDRDEWIRFWRQKIKGQGHCEIVRIDSFLLTSILFC